MDLEKNMESLSLRNSDESQSQKLRGLKVASNVFFIYHDESGFGNAIVQGLSPTPHSCSKVWVPFSISLSLADIHRNLD